MALETKYELIEEKSKMKKIALTAPDFGQNYDELTVRLAGMGYELVWMPDLVHTDEGIIGAISGFDGVIAGGEPWTAGAIEGVKDSVKIIARHGVGYDKVDIPAATKAGIAITNTPGKMSVAVAEQALSFIMCLTRETIQYDSEIRKGNWYLSITRELTGKTLGLVGFGAIAKVLAKLVKGFDLRILAYDIVADEQKAAELSVELTELEKLLKESDYVSVHCPLTDETKSMIGADFFGKMKNTAYFINTSRGGLVRENELINALKNGEIAGAGLDVFEKEPVEKDNELLGMSNVVLAPHVASATKESMRNMVECCVDNITAYFAGKTPPDLLNPGVMIRN